MLHRNNLYNIRINNISDNGTLNMGDAIHKGCSGNSEDVGGQTIIGNEHVSPVTHDYNL